MTMTLDDIRQHWERAGREFPARGDVSPTSRDPFLGQLEEDNVLSFLPGCIRALEVGCGDGAHTVRYARCVQRLCAVDIAESLVALASTRMDAAGIANVELSVGSVLDVPQLYGLAQFDCVISQRCLINLIDWNYQRTAIEQLGAVLKTGGLLLLTEGFQDGLDNLNAVRKRLGLEDIRVVPYNRNLVRREFEECIRADFDVVDWRDYGTYLFLSRVFHPLAVAPEAPSHDSRLNRAAMEICRVAPISELSSYSYNLFYALKKR